MEVKKDNTPNLSWEAFLDFDDKVRGEKMNFLKNLKKYSYRDFQRLDLKPPRKIVGREVGYFFEANGYKVKIWTTILEDQRKPRDKGTDVGWVLITKGDVVVYYAKCFLRIDDKFFLRILRYAWIAREKVLNIPLCRECKRQMEIKRNSKTNQTYFSCENVLGHSHVGKISESWDKPLEGKLKALEFLGIRRKQTAAYNKKNREAFEKDGTPIPTSKAKIRKSWIVGNPDNLKE